MKPDNTTSDLPILNWFDTPVKQSILSVFNDINKATEALDIFKRYRKNHFSRLRASISHIKILGMSQPILLTDIYSPARVSTTIYRRIYEQDWLSVDSPPPSNQVRRQQVGRLTRADEFFENNAHVVVLGSAGSGKTTLLRHLALSMCDKEVFARTKLKTSRFPFFVSLPSYAKATDGKQTIDEYLADELQNYTDSYAPEFVKRLLNKGLALLILDSLDEVPPSVRKAVISQVKKITMGFPNSRVVISCRTADYDPICEKYYEVELGVCAAESLQDGMIQ